MKSIIVLTLVLITASNFLFAQKAGRIDTIQHTTYYTCPMHSEVMSEKPGNCPKCGMKLNLSTKEEMKMEVTRSYSCPIHTDVISHDPGKCPKCGKQLNLSPKEQMKTEVMKIYTCPMHPEVALDKDGVCPKCGKTLVEKKKG